MRSSGWVASRTAAVTDLANTPGIKIKLIDHAETGRRDEKKKRKKKGKRGPVYI